MIGGADALLTFKPDFFRLIYELKRKGARWEGSKMAVEAKVSRKWQVVIPKKIREHLALRPGDRISFDVSGLETTIRKEKESPFDRYFGFLGKDVSTDESIKEMRGDR